MPLVLGEVEVVNEVALAPSAVLYDGAVTADGDLTVKVNAFYYDFAGSHGKYVGSCGNAVVDNATNYVYLLSTGALGINSTSYPGGAHIRLARVVTQGGFVVRIILERAFFTAGGSAVSTNAKSGTAVPGAFSGSPRKAVVTFTSPFATTQYAVTLGPLTDGSRTYTPSVEAKLTTGFTINLQSNSLVGLVEIGWHALPTGS